MNDRVSFREEWKWIVGYENRYSVSNTGKVVTHNVKIPREMKLKDRNGYESVQLFKNDSYLDKRVHRLVLEAFAGPCPATCECAHLDGNRKNNNISNLKWTGRQENMLHKIEHGTSGRGSKNGNSKLTEKEALKIYNLRKKGKTLTWLSNKFKISKATVSAISSKRNWKHIHENHELLEARQNES